MNKSTKGGKREGAGRPPTPKHLNKIMVSYRIPAWLKKWITEHDETASDIIEKSVISHYKLPPKPKGPLS